MDYKEERRKALVKAAHYCVEMLEEAGHQDAPILRAGYRSNKFKTLDILAYAAVLLSGDGVSLEEHEGELTPERLGLVLRMLVTESQN